MDRVSRSRLLRVSLTTAAALLLSAAAAAPLTAQTAREIIDKVDRMMRGESSHGRMTVDITTEHWSRSLDMEAWSLGAEHSLVRVESPAREAGTATLFAGDEVWNYLPRVDRTIKVPPALMMGSWMGSHLTNDDIVKESRIVDDYDFEISFEGEVDGVEVYEFTMTPRPEAPVVWGRVEEQVRKHDLMPTWVRYYDDEGTLVRTMTFSDYKMMSGRLVPAVFHIIPADKPEERTSMTYHELEFDIDLDESFFSLRTLRARR